jgi:hypothetical protein
MIMKSKHALSLMIALAVAAFVASALAQDVGRPRGVRGANDISADSAQTIGRDLQGPRGPDIRPDADPFLASQTSMPTPDPALKQLKTEEAAFEYQIDSLIRQLWIADSDARRDDVKTKVGEALGKQFDVRQKRHGIEIETLEARVKKLKQLVQKRQENRVEIISRRLDQVVRDSQGLGF